MVIKEVKMNKTKYLSIFEEYQDKNLKESTLIRKRQTVTKFLNYLENNGHNDLKDVSEFDFYNFVNSLNYRSQTLSGVRFTLRELANIYFQKGLLEFDGYKLFPLIKTNKRDSLLSCYTQEEISQLINAVNLKNKHGVRDKCMLVIAAQTGLRSSDIVGLKFDEILWDKKIISKIQAKTNKSVTVPFTDDILFLLLDYLKNYRPSSNSEFIFVSEKTKDKLKPAILTSVAYKNYKKSGINISGKRKGAHTLRHSLATAMLKNNTPMPIITGVLGHTSMNTTQKYISIDIEGLRSVSLEVPDVR